MRLATAALILSAFSAASASPSSVWASDSPSDACPPGFHCEALPPEERTTPDGPVQPNASDESSAGEAGTSDGSPPANAEPRSDPVVGGEVLSEAASTPPAESDRATQQAPLGDLDETSPPDFPIRPPPPKPVGWYRLRLVSRLGAPFFDAGASRDAGMLAAGVGLQLSPQRKVSFEAAVDGSVGTDYVGADRRELWVSASAVLKAGPSGTVPYVLLGPALSVAERTLDGAQHHFVYLGGHVGIGLSIEMSRRTSLTVDWVAFARQRIDGSNPPEYVDLQSGRHTNASGGGLFRIGMSFGL